ncbi:MAG: prephenate dehydratase [Acidimicrobiales bacterium]|nr:MAG: prephenate dehydratase [Acidimicrobiales bacterium]
MTQRERESFRVGFLGPEGTFTEQALLTQRDLAAGELVPFSSIPEVLAATEAGEVDVGFVAIENSIEGTVNVTLDTLAFESDLLIQREVVIDVQLNLLAKPGVKLDEVTTIVAFPHAAAQCRRFLSAKLGSVETVAANSTAHAARMVAEGSNPRAAAIATSLAADIYGLEVIATDIEDHPGNETRFVAVAHSGVPAPTGHDKTSLVVYQRADRPGSLLGILQEFAARSINLTKLESRPTKRMLGDYCFIIDLEGHISDEVVADALRNLKAKQADVKFLGSYPAAGDSSAEVRKNADLAWQAACEWVESIRSQVGASVVSAPEGWQSGRMRRS